MNPETHLLMQEPEFKERVVQLKNSGEYDSWKDIAEVIKQEFGKEVSENSLIKTYRKTLAMTVTVDKKADKQFTHLIDTLKDRFEKMVQRTEILSQAFDQLITELNENEQLSPAAKASAKLKLVDDLEKLNKVFTKQMEIVMDEIDKIKIEQSKMIYDDAMVVRKVNESLPHILKNLEDTNKIVILEKDLLN